MSFRRPKEFPVQIIPTNELLQDGLLIRDDGMEAIELDCGLENWRDETSGGNVTGTIIEGSDGTVRFKDLIGILIRGSFVTDDGDGFVEFVKNSSVVGVDVWVNGKYPSDTVEITYQ